MRPVKLIANLGYGSRKQVTAMFREGRVTNAGGRVLSDADEAAHADIRIDGEPLDPEVSRRVHERAQLITDEIYRTHGLIDDKTFQILLDDDEA